jgi:Xaa-Pro dipeptidase
MTDPRLQHFFDLMDEFHYDAVVINPGSTLTYLTGLHFHLMERPTVLIITRGVPPMIILPELEVEKLKLSRIPLTPVTFGDDPELWQQAFNKAVELSKTQTTTVGVESTHLRYLELNYLQKAAPQSKFIGADNLFSNLRAQKDEEEIAYMQTAVKIAQEALKATLPMIKPGCTEKEIASELVINMLRLGNDPELPFAPIVAGGPNSANPHATPSDRKIAQGDLLVIDWGASNNGYFSDLTRTFAIGQVDDELAMIYKTVQAANEAGRATGKPGIAAGKVDQAARTVIETSGYGKFFTHRTGHGLGMEEHETPYIFGANEQILEAGMVYTVEPGIYLPGHGGVRIEDDVVVVKDGSRSLSDFPRDLVILS